MARRTGFVASRIGAGDLADRALGLEACVATLRRALDAGVNVVDTAPAYEDGFSEEIVGLGRPVGSRDPFGARGGAALAAFVDWQAERVDDGLDLVTRGDMRDVWP